MVLAVPVFPLVPEVTISHQAFEAAVQVNTPEHVFAVTVNVPITLMGVAPSAGTAFVRFTVPDGETVN